MNNINDLNVPCTGCQMCETVCPYNAITIKSDSDGFYKPYVNDELCKNCSICKKTCIKYDENVRIHTVNRGIYAFKHHDKNVLKRVSSGGAAYALAQAAIKNGYMIAGTTYDCKSNRAKMVIDNNPEVFAGSKYIQSFAGNVYAELLNDKNKKYMVFGTPCQIYALDKATKLKNIRNNFVLVDFFCHGCPSMLLWDKYIKEYNSHKIEKTEFRSKAYAWHEYCISINNKPQKNSSYFYDLFFSDELLNEACYNCKCRNTFEYADIRVGDFWGDKYDGDSEGVSALTAVTETGKEWIDKLSEESIIAKHDTDDVIKYQAVNVKYSNSEALRKKLFDALKSETGIKRAVRIYYANVSLKKKIKLNAKKITFAMPFSFRAFLRKQLHK